MIRRDRQTRGSMLNEKVLLTYKRRRFSFQTDIAHDTKAINLSPNKPRGSSWITSPEYGCDAYEEKFKSHDPEKLQCSNCTWIYGYNDFLQQHVPATKRMRQSQITGQSDLGPIVLRSCKVLSGAKVVENISKKASSSTEHACWSHMKDTIRMGISVTEGRGYSSKHPEAGVKMSQHPDKGDNALCNIDGGLNEKSRTPLITFSRRAKPKQDAVKNTDENLKVVEKQSFSASCSRHAVGASFSCEGSSENHVFEEQMANAKVDATSDCTAEIFTGLNIMQRFENCSEFPVPPLSAANTCEVLSKEFSAVQPVVVNDYILSLCSETSNTGHASSLRGKESGNKLITDTNLSENRTIPHMSGLMDSPAGIDLSFVPASVCQMNLQTDKHSNVVPENHRESQSSSTPCCSLVFTDEENDARNKELEWLESLDKILREREKDKGKCSLMVHDGFDCREVSYAVKQTKSPEQSLDNQDIAINFEDQLSTLKNLSLANLPGHSCEEQQLKGKSAAFTNFLRPCLRSNPAVQMDLNSAATSSDSHFRNNLYMNDMQHPCSSYGTPSWLKHQLITENAIAEMILRGRQGFLSDKPKRFSNKWSEEELDFLWVGVRRHGINNWNAMLADPKLHFVQSRFPEDLALQWEQEQKKLFSVILFPPAMRSKPNTFSTPLFDGQYPAKYQAFAENPLNTTETKLSLGDVYFHKENIPKSSQFNPLGFGISYPLTSENPSMCPLVDSYSLASTYPGAAVRNQKSTSVSSRIREYDCHERSSERSAQEQHPAGLPASTNLPRWLKEVCSSRPTPNVLSRPSRFTDGKATTSANDNLNLCSPNSNLGEPLTSKDLRGRGILKRKSMVFGKNLGIIRVEEGSTPMIDSVLGPKLSVVQTQNLDSERPLGAGAPHKKYIAYLSNNTPVPVVPNDLVVIDSDASSEETLSDDQNSKL